MRESCRGDFAVGLQAGYGGEGGVWGVGFGEEEQDAGEVVEGEGCGGEGDGEEEFCYSAVGVGVGGGGIGGAWGSDAGAAGERVAEAGAGLEGEWQVGVPGVEVGR